MTQAKKPAAQASAAEAQDSAKAVESLKAENEKLREQLEAAQASAAEAQDSAKGVNEKAVLAAYDKGANYYTLAKKFVGFDSEEAVERIRQIIEG